jgi:NADPH:quinone reductase-like Zn-dependent oxidoreductase
MKALQIAELGAPEGLVLTEVPDPPPPGPGEVLLRTTAISLNYRDLAMLKGAYPLTSAPLIPFSDACAVVEAVGEGVERVKAGDRVATLFHQAWFDGPPTAAKLSRPLAQGGPGVGRERLVLSQEGVSRVPDFLTDEQVASLPCAALTAWRVLFEDGAPEPGAAVLLEGTGGVSIFGLQFAKAAGLCAIVTSSSDEKLARAKALGADHLINYRTTPEWSAEVRRVTEGRGAEIILDVGGTGTLPEAFKAVAVGGRIGIIGMLAQREGGVDTRALVRSNARLAGVFVGSRAMFEAMTRAIALHRIEPVVDRVFPWGEAGAALRAMERGEHFGKIVLKVG